MWWTVGQARAIHAIEADLAGQGPAHAYLFAGPPHTGKSTLALEVAMALNCEAEPTFRPCHECRQCGLIAEGKHADVQRLSNASPCDESGSDHDHAKRPATVIRLCQVQRARRVATEAPFEGRWRVFLVDPADLLNNDSANALLKTLEEPPAQVVFLLVSANEDAVPETVRSRCRRVALGPVALREIVAHLGARTPLAEEEIEAIARLARGRIGWAIEAATADGLRQRSERIAELVELAHQGRVRRFAVAADLAKTWTADRDAVRATLETWEEWWRDVLLAALGRPELAAHRGQRATLEEEASRYTPRELVQFLERLREAESFLEENINPRLALETAMLAMPPARSAAAGAGRG